MQRVGQVEKDDTRARLLDAAASIFAELGYHAATTRDICARAQANAAAVNYHFGDKSALYAEVLKSVMPCERVLRNMRADAEEPEAALKEFIRSMFENMSPGSGESADRYTRLMAHELAQPTPGLSMVVEQIIRPRAERLCEIVSRLTGHPRTSMQTRLYAHSVIGQIIFYSKARPVVGLLWPDWPSHEEMREKLIAHVTCFSLAAMGVVKPRARSRSAL
jgi:AcrR family transcriptional regulator